MINKKDFDAKNTDLSRCQAEDAILSYDKNDNVDTDCEIVNTIYKKAAEKKLKNFYLVSFFLGVVTLTFINYSTVMEGEGCYFERIFGVYTPSCGITRATYCLLRFDVATAFKYNQFFVVFLPIIAYQYIAGFINVFAGKKIVYALKIKPIYIILLLTAFFLYGILRNIPLFSCLRPL